MNSKNKIIIITTLIVLFFLILVGVKNHNPLLYSLDQNTATLVNEIKTPKLNNFMFFITKTLDPYQTLLIFILLSIFLLYKRNKKDFYTFSIACSLGITMPQIFKILVERVRPTNCMITETGFSFPSGHATMATVLLICLITTVTPHIKNKFSKYFILAISVVILPIIAFSRVYLSVHFATDIIAGITLGIVCYMITTEIVDRQTK